jgi:hypothetical protein
MNKVPFVVATLSSFVFSCGMPEQRVSEKSLKRQWELFSLPIATDAIEAKLPVCFCLTTDSTIGASPVAPLVLSENLFKSLSERQVKFFEIRLSDLQGIPDSFVARYLKRTIPSLSIVSASGSVYSLSGTFDKFEAENLLQFVLLKEGL